MKLLIIGATKGIGFKLVEQAVNAGHNITVLVRSVELLGELSSKIKIVKGSITSKESVEDAVKGQEAVCVSTGYPPGFKKVTAFSEGIKNVIESMNKNAVAKLICVTGIGAGDSRNHGGFAYDKIFKPLFLGRIYDDKDRQELLIKGTNLKWVIVRPGFLTDGPLTGSYKAVTDLTGIKAGKISRNDVAHFMLTELHEEKYLHETPLLTY